MKKVKLKDISSSFSGGTPNTSNNFFYNGDINFIGSGEIGKNITSKKINIDALKESSAKLVEKGDLLYAMYGANSGNIAITPIEGAINQAILCIKPDAGLNKLYLFFQLEHMKSSIINKYLQGGQGNLSASQIMNLSIKLPHIDEQNELAIFLSTMDKLIEEKQSLVDNLVIERNFNLNLFLKNSISNNLCSISELITKYSEKNVNDNLEVASVGKYGIRMRSDVYSKSLSDDYTKNKVIKKDTIVFGMGSTQIDYGVIIDDVSYCVSPAYHTFNVNTDIINTKFLQYLFDKDIKKMSLMFMITSSRQGKSVNFEELLNYKFDIPNLESQKKIVNIVSSMDKLIDLHKQELEELKNKKKYYLNKIFN
jgi:type I restriction enzyme S subunit